MKPSWNFLCVKSIVVVVKWRDEEEASFDFDDTFCECFDWNSSINWIISSITLISSSLTRISACLDNRRSFNFSRIFVRYVSFPRWDKKD